MLNGVYDFVRATPWLKFQDAQLLRASYVVKHMGEIVANTTEITHDMIHKNFLYVSDSSRTSSTFIAQSRNGTPYYPKTSRKTSQHGVNIFPGLWKTLLFLSLPWRQSLDSWRNRTLPHWDNLHSLVQDRDVLFVKLLWGTSRSCCFTWTSDKWRFLA